MKPGLQSGRCRWCRCTYERPCPQGCGWADRAQTLCTACVDVDRAWQKLTAPKLPNMHRAFFRGFIAAAEDARADDGFVDPRTKKLIDPFENPYGPGRTAQYWIHGFTAGERMR